MGQTNINFVLRGSQSPSSPVSGELTALTTFEGLLSSGTSANQADLASKTTQSITGSGNSDIDLLALTDVFGDAMSSLTEVVGVVLESAAGNGDVLSVKPASSNGWTALLADASDIIKLQPGARLILWSPADGGYPVSGTNKAINVANADASDATLTITLIGRSA